MTKQWGVLALTLGLALCAAGAARADDQTKPDDTKTNDTIHDQSTMPTDQKTGDVDNDSDVQQQRGVDQTTSADTDSKSVSIKSLKPEQLKELQQKLTDKGFYQGKIDGHAGPLTLAAFHQFQKDQGVAISDKIDFTTASALGITLDENEMKPVRGVDESGKTDSDVNGTQNQSGTDTANPTATPGTVNQSGTDSGTSGTTQNQSGTDTSATDTTQNQSGTDTSATGTTQNQSGTDTSTGTMNQGSTDIQNQSGTDIQKNKCKDLSSPDAVNCTDGTKNQSGTSGTSSSTDIQNQSGTSTSTTDKGSTGYGAGSSSTGTSSYGGVNTDTSTGVQNQSGRDVTAVSDPATIKSAKQALRDKHFYKGKINEKNDDKFQASLRDFQKKNHLAITGTLDQPTLAALGIQAGATDNGTMNNGTMNDGTGTMDNGTNPGSTPAPAATGTPSSNPY